MNISRILVLRSALVLGLLSAAMVMLGPVRVASAAPSARPVASVEVDRSGGITGTSDHFTVSAGSPHADASRLLRVAGSHQFRVLRDAYLDDNSCCDRYRYVVTVHYRNGAAKTVTAVEGAPGLPAVLREVIDLTVTIGPSPQQQQR